LLRVSLTQAEENLLSVVRLTDQLPITRAQLSAPQGAHPYHHSAGLPHFPPSSAPAGLESERATLLAQASLYRSAPPSSSQDPSSSAWGFLTMLWRDQGRGAPGGGSRIGTSLLPQLMAAAVLGYLAQVLKLAFCTTQVTAHNQCPLTFSSTMHVICASALGFLLVDRAHQAYSLFYMGRSAMDRMFASLRNTALALATFEQGPPELKARASDPHHLHRAMLESKEVGRLTDIIFALIRQAVREKWHSPPGNRSPGVGEDSELLAQDRFGIPSLKLLLQPKERTMYSGLEAEARVPRALMLLRRLVERRRRLRYIPPLAATLVNHNLTEVMEAYNECLAVSRSVEWEYRGSQLTVSLLLVFVFSSPFMLSLSFSWLTSIGTTLIAAAFYGIAEVSTVLREPFQWGSSPLNDLTSMGTRLHNEVHLISQLIAPPSSHKALVVVA